MPIIVEVVKGGGKKGGELKDIFSTARNSP
jgi:hypothetical protein